MQDDKLSNTSDLEAILRFLDANKSHLGDGDGVKDVVSAFATILAAEVFGDSDECSFSSGEFKKGRFDDVFNSGSGEQLLGEISSSEVSMPIFVFADRRSLATFIDLKFGGDGTQVPESDAKDISIMDRSIAELLFVHVASALTATMSTFPWRSPILAEQFVSSSTTDLPDGGEDYDHIKLQIEKEGVKLAMMISFPHDLIETFRAEANSDTEEKDVQSSDPDWARHVEHEIMQSRIGLRALVAMQEFSIAEISQITVGQVLPINAKADDRLPILGDDSVLFFSNIGQLNGAYAMRVVDVLEPIDQFSSLR